MLLPDDIFYLICSHISNLQELIKLELLSSYYTQLIRKNKWNTFIARKLLAYIAPKQHAFVPIATVNPGNFLINLNICLYFSSL